MKLRKLLLPSLLLPLTSYASFIETTVGTAVVNDASASYFNPAALVQLKNPQIIPQETLAEFSTRFNGRSTAVSTGVTSGGSSSSTTDYQSPALFLGMPATDKLYIGFASVSNSANRSVDENPVLRYVQSANNIHDYDFVPAFAFKINPQFAIGGGVNFSYAKFDLKPVTGFPGTNIADGQSNNQSDGTGIGFNAGFIVFPAKTTVVGFNYRSRTTYRLSGSSTYRGVVNVTSNDYHFKQKTPARSVLSINHFFNQTTGAIATVQYIQWSAITNLHVYNIATVAGTTPVIASGSVPYYLRDTWMATLGGLYRLRPGWIARAAASYSQSPGNPHYQLAHGDSIILGASMGYEINKIVTVDGSYAHAFIKNENINVNGNRFQISGVNQGSRDAVSLKLTFNL